jgi:hypothetical protein
MRRLQRLLGPEEIESYMIQAYIRLVDPARPDFVRMFLVSDDRFMLFESLGGTQYLHVTMPLSRVIRIQEGLSRIPLQADADIETTEPAYSEQLALHIEFDADVTVTGYTVAFLAQPSMNGQAAITSESRRASYVIVVPTSDTEMVQQLEEFSTDLSAALAP